MTKKPVVFLPRDGPRAIVLALITGEVSGELLGESPAHVAMLIDI